MTPQEAAAVLRRKIRYLQTRDKSNRSAKALDYDREEIDALSLATRALDSMDPKISPMDAMQQLCDEIDKLKLGYGEDMQPMWNAVSLCRMILN